MTQPPLKKADGAARRLLICDDEPRICNVLTQ